VTDVTTTETIVRPRAYSRCRIDQISYDVRKLLREVETGDHFGSEAARDQAKAHIAHVNDILDQFLPN